MSLSGSGITRKGFLDSPETYNQPKCYVRIGDDLKNIQCYELVEILLSTRGFESLVCNEVTSKCVEVRSTDKLVITEVSGNEVFISVKEGDYVKQGDRLGYIVTNKGEVRGLRSDVEGVVVLVHEVPTSRPSKVLVFIKESGG